MRTDLTSSRKLEEVTFGRGHPKEGKDFQESGKPIKVVTHKIIQ